MVCTKLNVGAFAVAALAATAASPPICPQEESAVPDYLKRYKLPEPVLRPTHRDGEFDSDMVDCPWVIRYEGEWLMLYTGFDGVQYRLGLATSDDLIHWQRAGMVMDAGAEGEWDYGSAGGASLIAHDGRWYLFYCGFPETGYEAGPGKTGIARAPTPRGPFAKFHHAAVLLPGDGDAWDAGGIYKAVVYERDGTFFLFYNAKDKGSPWVEQTGVATSSDLIHWAKYEGNPILRHGPEGAWDSRFASDPMLLEINGVWHMFYYGFDGQHACDGVALSVDGSWLHWEKSPHNPILTPGLAGSHDDVHAHKPFVLEHGGVFYHFYCGVGDERTICLATSKPL